jgi:putative ABC transport system permease protein
MNRIARFFSGWSINMGIAFTALGANKLRSALTVLGVMIGVFAVILAVAVGSGAKASVSDSISALGSNMALVFPFPDREGGRSTNERGRLTERDARALLQQLPDAIEIAPQLRSQVQLVSAGRNATTSAIGTTAGYGIVTNISSAEGRFLTEADVRSAARVVVLGPTVARKLFGGVDPLGRDVRINRMPFTVIGVLESKGSSFGNDNDDLVLMPLSTMRQRFSTGDFAGPDDLAVLFINFSEGTSLEQGKKDITRILRDRYRVPSKDISPFTVRTTEEFMQQTGQITSVVQIVLVAIASISLLVGGIGIMNIMLVSVTERTREIGLRMALGARGRDIRNQFLVEAAVLCVIGGAAGMALAAGVAALVTKYADFPVPVGMGTAFFAILFSAIVGLGFGLYPAIRAAKLSPIEALRSE